MAAAVAKGDADAIYEMLSEKSKRGLSRDEVKKLVADERAELTDQAKADHYDRLAHGGLQQTNTLQCDCTHNGECRVLVADLVWDARAEIDGNYHHLRMFTVARDPIANLEPVRAGTGLQDDPDVAVAERQRPIEPVPLQAGGPPLWAAIGELNATSTTIATLSARMNIRPS